MALCTFWPFVKRPGVDDNLPFRIQRHLRAIHRARRRTFKVNAFTVVATAMARAFELVFTRLPVGCAAQMSAACVNDEEPIGRSRHPDSILLLPFGIDADGVVSGRSDTKDAGRFEN